MKTICKPTAILCLCVIILSGCSADNTHLTPSGNDAILSENYPQDKQIDNTENRLSSNNEDGQNSNTEDRLSRENSDTSEQSPFKAYR